jgi:ABC-type transport system involved in multi-copper enzyme maturation permease subunit
MRKRWATWIMVAILLAWLVLLVYALLYLVIKTQPASFRGGGVSAEVLKRQIFPENFIPTVLSTAASIGAAILIIFGALSTASEYGWSTVQTILIQKPGRTAVLGGKLVALGVATVLISIAALAVAALSAYVVVTLDGSSSSWPAATQILKGFGALALQLAVWAAFGAFLGIAFRSTAAAIGGGLVYLFVGEALIGGLFRNTPVIKSVLKYLPGINADAVNAAFPLSYRNPNTQAPLVDPTHGVITLLIYLVAFTALSLLIFRRRDVGGG